MMENRHFVLEFQNGTIEHFNEECNYIDTVFDSKCVAFKNLDDDTKTELILAIVPIDAILIIKSCDNYLQEDNKCNY